MESHNYFGHSTEIFAFLNFYRRGKSFLFYLNAFRIFVRWILLLVISGLVISAFLSHWSLLDGAPRNSLKLFLDGQAHRPFAYRILGPSMVNAMEALLPEMVQSFLAEKIAPKFWKRYVEPLMGIYEEQLPGISQRAATDWNDPHYRSAYVLMVMLIFISFAGAMIVIRRCARLLGANPAKATCVMLLYAAVVPTLFLNGGYFYDFTEQLGACLLIWYVLQARWLPALGLLLLMQANKETALLMVMFLAPFSWRLMGWRMFPRATLALLSCLVIFLWIRWAHAALPGQPTEWHLPENLIFWSRLASWMNTEDFYSLGLALPRMSYLLFVVATVAFGCYKGASPMLLAASLAFVTLAALLLTLGFQDEFRNLSLGVPLMVLIWAQGSSLARGKAQTGWLESGLKTVEGPSLKAEHLNAIPQSRFRPSHT